MIKDLYDKLAAGMPKKKARKVVIAGFHYKADKENVPRRRDGQKLGLRKRQCLEHLAE